MEKEPKTAQRPRIPRFKSIEEEAEFWDTHDSTEFEHLFRPTRLRFAEKVEHVFSVPLDPPVLDLLIQVAHATGEPSGALAARLITEGLERTGAKLEPRISKRGKQHG
jgi:hypothetical protein